MPDIKRRVVRWFGRTQVPSSGRTVRLARRCVQDVPRAAATLGFLAGAGACQPVMSSANSVALPALPASNRRVGMVAADWSMIPLPDCLDGARCRRASRLNLTGPSTYDLWLTKSDQVPIIARRRLGG